MCDKCGCRLLSLLSLENLDGHVVDGGVVQYNDTSVGTRLDVNAYVFTEFVVAAAKVIPDGLYGYIEFISNLMSCAIG